MVIARFRPAHRVELELEAAIGLPDANDESAALSTSVGSIFRRCVPTMTSMTWPFDFLRSVCPSCCATQPATATTGLRPVSCSRTRNSPRRV